MEVATLERWIQRAGFRTRPESASTLQVVLEPDGLPPFFLQLSEHWVMLSMLPMLAKGRPLPFDIGQRLLAANREMRLAKFAIDADGELVLCAELPTESLDESELADAVKRIVDYARDFVAEFGAGA